MFEFRISEHLLMSMQHKTHTVTSEQSGRVDLVVKSMIDRSRSQVRGMCLNGCITVNGRKTLEPSTAVQAGDVVEVRFDPQRKYRETWLEKFQCKSFKVVFEDDYLIVVEKQAGILTVPTELKQCHSLVDEVSRYLGGRSRALVVHRLDRETSGLLVFAKQSEIAGALQDQLRLRAPEREYLAIVAGRMEKKSGTFESYLATSKRLSRHSVDNPKSGEYAVTHFQVEQALADTTLVRIKLDTGRRNQIRVHLAEAGHPIIGDRRYRPNLSKHPDWPHVRLALHAHVLGFQHPVTGKNLRFVSPMPRSFQIFVRLQRRAARSGSEPSMEVSSKPAEPRTKKTPKRLKKSPGRQ